MPHFEGKTGGGWQMNNLLRLLVIAGLAAGVIVIVALGLERHNADLLAPLPLFYLKIGLEIAREDELLEEIERRSVRATEAGGR